MKTIKRLTAIILSLVMICSMETTANAADIRYTGLRAALDALPLTPQNTGITEIDAYLDQVLALITTPEMDTHDKLKSCYDYLITAISYGMSDNYWQYVWTYGDYGRGYIAMTEGLGVCDDYSSAFCMLANKIGIPVKTVSGQTHATNGSFTPHTWCELDMGNGTIYVFDPQVEDAIAGRQGGRISYLRFGGTTAQLADKYIHDYELAQADSAERCQTISTLALLHFSRITGIEPQHIGVEFDGKEVVAVHLCDLVDGQLAEYDAYVINIYTATGYTISGETVDLTSIY